MRKIPTLFLRDPDDMSRVLPQVHPDCLWVIAGEGVPTRKYDGTCVMLDVDGNWWARREVKKDKVPPPGWRMVDHDDVTGKSVGWEPMAQSSFAKFHTEALEPDYAPGTYELVGPKINKNPEGTPGHRLIRHSAAEEMPWCALGPGVAAPVAFAMVRDHLVPALREMGAEGVVWHHQDGRMAKIKVRDFR